MYLGEIQEVNGKVMVHLPNVPFQQKLYPISVFSSVTIIDKLESRIVEVDLIPNQGELDEQPEYIARIVKPSNYNFNDN